MTDSTWIVAHTHHQGKTRTHARAPAGAPTHRDGCLLCRPLLHQALLLCRRRPCLQLQRCSLVLWVEIKGSKVGKGWRVLVQWVEIKGSKFGESWSSGWRSKVQRLEIPGPVSGDKRLESPGPVCGDHRLESPGPVGGDQRLDAGCQIKAHCAHRVEGAHLMQGPPSCSPSADVCVCVCV